MIPKEYAPSLHRVVSGSMYQFVIETTKQRHQEVPKNRVSNSESAEKTPKRARSWSS
jgi:hypothetical protein